MDPTSTTATAPKKPDDVVVLIPEAAAAAAAAAATAAEEPNPKKPISPEISKFTSPTPSPRKPPRPPPPHSDTLRRRNSINAAPGFAKPKSRFVEQPPPPPAAETHRDPIPPSSSPFHGGSPNPRTPKTPSVFAEDEEEEEDEVYQKITERRLRRRRGRARATIEWSILILAMGCLIASLTVHALQRLVFWGLEIWKWCLMIAVICCGHLVSQFLINILVFLIERNFLLRKKVLYFVYGLKKSVQVCIWLGLVLLTWSLLFNHGVRRSPKVVKVLDYVSRFLASLLIGSVIWLVKTLLLKILASSFHMNRFFDRIQESLFNQYVLQTLLGPPANVLAKKFGHSKSVGQLSFRSTGRGKDKSKGGEELGVIDVAKLHKMRQEKVSAWTMKGLMTAIRSSGLMSISNTIDQSFDDANEQGEREITSEWEAKAVAREIFKNVAKPGSKYIEEEDLLRFLSKEEVDNLLLLFQGEGEPGKIKKSTLKNWVVKAYLDRKSLAHSLNDTKTAVNQLHKVATAAVIIVIIVISLLLLGFATTQVLVFISSQLLLVAFMFGNTCKTAFESIIFVFVMHPFDVGDRCVIDGVQMIVEEMNILSTVFLRYDNEKIYYPNSVLSTKPISNFYRSPDMGDSVLFSVDVKTSMECIGALKARIKSYIDSKPNHWRPNHSIVVKDIVDVNTMNMALFVTHTMNFQNMGEKSSRRSDLVLELKKIFEGLSIQYHLLPQKVHLSYTGSTPLPMALSQSI